MVVKVLASDMDWYVWDPYDLRTDLIYSDLLDFFFITSKNELKVSRIKKEHWKRVNQEKMHTFALINVPYEYRTTTVQ